MRDQLDIDRTGINSIETQPLIPDPPVSPQPRVQQRSYFCHRCWSFFRRCSRWTCILFALMFIILLLVLLRALLPFGWPSWFPSIIYNSSDPHIFVIIADDIGWSDLGFSTYEYSTPTIDKLYTEGIQSSIAHNTQTYDRQVEGFTPVFLLFLILHRHSIE